MKKFLFSLIMLSSMTCVYAAPKFDTKVFVGELTVFDKNRAILEYQSLAELQKEDPTFKPKGGLVKKEQEKLFAPTDLSINLNNLSKFEINKLFSKCNDGQLCRVTATVKKEKVVHQEAESYWLIGIKDIEVLR